MQQYHNILVYSMVNLGDVLMTTSATALLRASYPEAKITMMVRPVVADILQNNPVVDCVIPFDYKGKQCSVKEMLIMIKRLRRCQFDLCISYDRKLRPALLAILAGIPVRVGPDKVFDDKPSWVPKLYTHISKIPHDLVNALQVETYRAIISEFTKVNCSTQPVLGKCMPKNEQKAENLLSFIPQNTLKIALCVKGTFPLKNWPQEYFAELVDKLAQTYQAAFYIIGAPEDKEYADEVISKAKTPIVNLCGETSLLDLAALFSKSDIFITVDTGAMHIAATTNVPMVAIFGCTSPKRWHPISAQCRVLYTGETCSPCSVRADGCPKHICMNTIEVEQVIEAVAELNCLNSKYETRS